MAVSFAAYLNTLVRPPNHPGAVTSAQVQGWLQQRSHPTRVMKELGDLKVLLKKVPGITARPAWWAWVACSRSPQWARQKGWVRSW
jgi:hypothetical protein